MRASAASSSSEAEGIRPRDVAVDGLYDITRVDRALSRDTSCRSLRVSSDSSGSSALRGGAGEDRWNLVTSSCQTSGSMHRNVRQSSSGSATPTSDPRRGRTSRTSFFSREEGRTVTPVSRAKRPRRVELKVRCASCARQLLESKRFIAFAMLLTMWSLTGDDLRLMFTDKTADPIFNYISIACMLFFLIDIILNCMSSHDYPGSFFMFLDVIATASMVFDITWVMESFVDSTASGEGDGGALRGGRSAKIGARLTRIFRVVRLVRVARLYQNAQGLRRRSQAEVRRRATLSDLQGLPGTENDDASAEAEVSGESQIGKRLSDLTIRVLISLILALLLVLPLLNQEEVGLMPFSADYGANAVWQAFQAYGDGSLDRVAYEESLLRYIYYHNWFAHDGSQGEEYSGAGFASHLFWVGVLGEDDAVVASKAANATVRPSTFDSWVSRVRHDAVNNYGTVPQQALRAITGEWSVQCDMNMFRSRGFSLLSQGVVGHAVQCPGDLRWQEGLKYSPRRLTTGQFAQYHLAFFFDLRPFVYEESKFQILTTFFVLVVLIWGSAWMLRGSNQLLIRPLEMMILRVHEIRDNPVDAIRMADKEYMSELREKTDRTMQKRHRWAWLPGASAAYNYFHSSTAETTETVILEKTIIKLGGLLVLCFGSAGANIIKHNLKGGETVDINAMVPGVEVDCIIGVARVSNFSITTEVLQARIMTFAKQIAEVVHGVANEYHAVPNRNNGEVFLLVWRSDGDFPMSRLADMSMAACVKIMGALHRSPHIATYRFHPGLQKRLGADSKVNMTFGLHAGWAIEGAIGSDFKVDASYVSPNVNLAYSVETATQAYGMPLIASRVVIEHCTLAMADMCRCIDNVHMSGYTEPLELYCLDLDPERLPLAVKQSNIKWNAHNRVMVREFLENEKKTKIGGGWELEAALEADHDFAVMRQRYTREFIHIFSMGYLNYKEGEWRAAGRLLRETLTKTGKEDGPSAALLRFMEGRAFEPPAGWRGVRDFVC